jgi:hypothetical protein
VSTNNPATDKANRTMENLLFIRLVPPKKEVCKNGRFLRNKIAFYTIGYCDHGHKVPNCLLRENWIRSEDTFPAAVQLTSLRERARCRSWKKQTRGELQRMKREKVIS